MLWNIDRRKQEIAKGASRIKSLKDIPAFLHATSCYHPHHVSFLWTSRHHHFYNNSSQQTHHHHHRSPPTNHQWLPITLVAKHHRSRCIDVIIFCWESWRAWEQNTANSLHTLRMCIHRSLPMHFSPYVDWCTSFVVRLDLGDILIMQLEDYGLTKNDIEEEEKVSFFFCLTLLYLFVGMLVCHIFIIYVSFSYSFYKLISRNIHKAWHAFSCKGFFIWSL